MLLETAVRRCSIKLVFLEISQNSQKNSLRPETSLKKETLAQVFSCEFYEICKNTFLTEHLKTTASGYSRKYCSLLKLPLDFTNILKNLVLCGMHFPHLPLFPLSTIFKNFIFCSVLINYK